MNQVQITIPELNPEMVRSSKTTFPFISIIHIYFILDPTSLIQLTIYAE